jgi:glycosyltransferase involved in cell wall biosynthesis
MRLFQFPTTNCRPANFPHRLGDSLPSLLRRRKNRNFGIRLSSFCRAVNTVAMNRDSPLLCVIAPCYNEVDVVGLFYRELKNVLNSIPDLRHRILFVDDGSDDETLEALNALAAKDACIRVCSLSRNFGHQVALTAGLDFATGDAVVLMDSDLQHPPQLIPEMVKHWRDGCDVVSAIRSDTAGSGSFKRCSSSMFYRLINWLSDIEIVDGAVDFCLLSRKAHQALRQFPERHRFLRGMVSWMGFRRKLVNFSAPPRAAGHSKYTLMKMLKLALNAIFSFSVIPIRLAAQIGLVTIFLSLVYLVYILFVYFFRRDLVAPGWASIIFVVTFLGGVQLAFVGLLGEYIARIFEQVKGRPIYLLKQAPQDAESSDHQPTQ